MTDLLKPDLCVIGAGSGGLTVTAVAAQMGLDVVLIEKAKMGGDCLNYGCVPSKSLIAAAKFAHAPATSPAFGVTLGAPEVNFARVHDHIRAVIAGIAPHDSVERFEGLGATVIEAAARFTGPREVEAGGQRIRARRYVVAAGSHPTVPPIPGLDGVPFLTNETIFDLKELPAHLLIMGGGPIGMEMAQAFRRLGADVTVASPGFLAKDDPELTEILRVRLEKEGVRHVVGKVGEVGRTADGITLKVQTGDETQTVSGSHLLVAAGRAPNTGGLGLEEAGIDVTERGISVDNRLRTSNRRIYAIGDITGRFQFTHTAGYDAGIVIRNALFRWPARARADMIPWVTYTDPELAHVGLTEAEARDQGHWDLRVLRWPFAENDRARTERDTEGLIKVVATARGKILGASILGSGAGELIQPWCLALADGLKLSALASYIAPYPTRGEITKRAAGEFFAPALFGARARWLVRLLMKLP